MEFKVCDYSENYIRKLKLRSYVFFWLVFSVSILFGFLDGEIDRLAIAAWIDWWGVLTENVVLYLAVIFFVSIIIYLLGKAIDFHFYDQTFETTEDALVRLSASKRKVISFNQIRRIQHCSFAGIQNISESGKLLHMVLIYYRPKAFPWIRLRMTLKIAPPEECAAFANVLSAEINVPLKNTRYPFLYFFNL